MGDIIKITDEETFQAWLEEQELQTIQLMASRLALRTLPNVLELHEIDFGAKYKNLPVDLTTHSFRASFISWAARRYPAHDMIAAATATTATLATIATAVSAVRSSAHYAALSASSAAGFTALSTTGSTAVSPAQSAAHSAVGSATRSAVWDMIQSDARAVELGFNLLKAPLWFTLENNAIRQSPTPEWALSPLAKARKLPEFASDGKDGKFGLWLDWYDAQLENPPRSIFGETKDIKLATQPEEFWEGDAFEVMERVAELVGWPFSSEEIEEVVGELEPQNTAAITFKTDQDGLIIVDHNPRADELAADENAADRHGEVLRLTNKLINSFDPTEQGANAAAELIEDVTLFRDTLGEQPSAANIDYLIPRGDGLRNILTAQTNKDEMSDLPPISDKYLTHLKSLIGAYNIYVSLDPVLAERDEAIFGPDYDRKQISPAEGREVIQIAIELNVAHTEVGEIIDLEASVAPETPDPTNRKSRRLTEAVKNFARKVLSVVTAGAAGAAGAAGIFAGANWIIAKEVWLLDVFSNHPAMVEFIVGLIKYLQKFPL